MAIVRCKDHPPKGRTRSYERCVEPVGYPETAMVCGCTHCENPDLIWLETSEVEAFSRGEKIFKSFTATMKMKAK